jgi:alkanesulfonate monooxygenase SsuD/methylene tetrahydromethanopterin reductase-like flavin-dependent oxidoreductase (luciferase family)
MRIDIAGWTREATDMDHRAFLAIFEEADRLGFDGVWFNEFHFHTPRIPYPFPHLLAAAIFARTERLRVGTSIIVLPLHHPMLLAEEIGQLDVQSHGRLDVGIGRGTSPEVLRSLDISPDAARERFETGLLLLREALSTGVAISTDGPWRFPETVVGPRPIQTPHPPIYVAGSTPETIGFAVGEDLPLLLSLEPPEARQLAVLQGIADARVPSLVARSSLSRYVVVGRTRAEAAALLDPLLAGLEDRRRHFAAARGQPAAPLTRETIIAERIVWGDPEQCGTAISALAATTGVQSLRCVFNGNGVLDLSVALPMMRLFAAEVLPMLKRSDQISAARPAASASGLPPAAHPR